MAIDFIRVNTSDVNATRASRYLRYTQLLRDALEAGEHELAVMNHNNDGEDWTFIEALYGLPPGKGQILYNLTNGSVGSMKGLFQTADAKNLTETVG
jgi:hypothetical protein